jgi:hypothetical protein
MATDKQATTHKHATVDAVSLGSVPVVTSSNSRGIEEVFSLGSVHGLYSSGIYGTVAVTSEYSGRAAVFRDELQANGSCDIGRQETSEDTVRRLGKCYSELRV